MESKPTQNTAANRAAYAKLAPALEAWRKTIFGKVEQAQMCRHTFTRNVSGVFICAKCGQPAEVELAFTEQEL